jgi:hypothetical protein
LKILINHVVSSWLFNLQIHYTESCWELQMLFSYRCPCPADMADAVCFFSTASTTNPRRTGRPPGMFFALSPASAEAAASGTAPEAASAA